MHGRVFGERTIRSARESGYQLEGRITIESKQYRAFTSSKLFARADGTLCDVAILYVCNTPIYRWKDPLTLATESAEYRAYLGALASRYHYERNGPYERLCRYATCLERIASGWAHENPHCETERETDELRAELAPIMEWK